MEGKSVETETKCEGDDQHQLSPTKPHHQIHHRASPLEFLKKRVKPGKKRRDSGHSEGGDCDSVSTIDEERSDGTPSSPTTTDPSSAASRRLSLDSASSQTSQPHQQSFSREKPRRGIAKVFHDLKHRSRARKSHSAPPASMDNNQVSSPLSPVAVDDDSFSSYATPMEAHSSGYSTPMFESNIASPESSLTESFVEEEEEAAEDTTTVETSQSPAAVPSIQLVNPPSTPGSPSTVDVETLSMLMSRTSIQTEPVDARETLASSNSSNTGKPHFEATETQQEAAPCAEAVASVTSSVSSSSSGTSGSPSEVSTSITTGQRSRIPLLSQHRASVPNYSSTKERTVAVPVATTSGDASKAQPSDRSASTSEIRFCFSEYINGDSASSPGRGFMRSLPSDPKMDPANNTTGNDANGYPKNEHLYKVLVIGELGTGKTSIIKRYVHQFFSQHYRATIGVDFALKVVHWDQSTVIRLQLWDIAGQERFGNMTRVYYKEAVGAFIVFDVTRSSTFESVTKWKQDLDSKVQLPDGSPIPCVLLANKCDQPKEGIAANPAKMDEYCKEKGFAGWFETSAKDNINIDDAAKFLVGTILQNDQWSTSIKEEDADKLELNGKGTSAAGDKKKSGCC